MRNIAKKGWAMRGMVILTLVMNIIIIQVANNDQFFLWLLFISITLLVMTVFYGLQWNRSLPSLLRRLKSVSRRRYELLPLSNYARTINTGDLRVIIGNDQCRYPYNACLLSIESQENGNYSRLARQGLNGREFEMWKKIKLSPSNGLQVDTSHQKCRIENGCFDSLAFKRIAGMPGVKMIEINLNDLDGPGYGMNLISGMPRPTAVRDKPDMFANSGYSTFCDAEGLMHFIDTLRKLSRGKPVGMRLSINDKRDFHKICYAIKKTQIIPDFVVVTGPSEKAAFRHSDSPFYPSMPLYEALLLVSQTLRTNELDENIKVIAEAEVISGFDILKLLALGANSVCIDSTCFNIPDLQNKHELKSDYLNNHIHNWLMGELVQIMNVGCFPSVRDVTLSKFLRHLEVLHSSRYAKTEEHTLLRPIKKMFDDKVNKMGDRNRKSQQDASLQ